MYKKALVPVVLCLSALLFATTTGYFMASSGYQTIPPTTSSPGCGPSFSCDPGPAVVLASQGVPKGTYVLTARVDGGSYSPNSGASCFFTGNGTDQSHGPTNPNPVLDTSSNEIVQSAVTQTWVAQAHPTLDTTISLVCQRGYQFEGGSQMKGAATIVKVKD